MCTGLTYQCCQLLMNKLSLYVNLLLLLLLPISFFVLHRLRCLNIAWTDLSCESVQYICETIPRCIEQLNISGQRCNLTDDSKKTKYSH
jgi:hypothetical protein